MSEKIITWLHLSDLHTCAPKTGWDSYRVLETLEDDLRFLESYYGLHPDFIFFTGDAAFGHLPGQGFNIAEQFNDAENFFTRVRNVFETPVPKKHFFIVPGNHDVDRSMVTDDQIQWLMTQGNQDAVTAMIHSGNRQWQRAMERLNSYKEFLETEDYSHLLADPKRLVFTNKLDISGTTVGIAGFNSAWSCCRDKEKGALWLGGEWQSSNLHREIANAQLSIALMHHPLNWFVEQEDPIIGRRIERYFTFFLHGHEHQGWVDAKADGHIRVAASACYDRSDQDNGYNFVRIDLENKTGEVFLRRFDPEGGGWIQRTIHGRTNREGIWPLNNIRILRAEKTHLLGTSKAGMPIISKPQESLNEVTSIELTFNSLMKDFDTTRLMKFLESELGVELSKIEIARVWQGSTKVRLEGETAILSRIIEILSVDENLMERFSIHTGLKRITWDERGSSHTIDVILRLSKEDQIKDVDLSSQDFTNIPETLRNFKHIQKLNLSNNHLLELPEWLKDLTELQELDVSRNQLKKLPEWLGYMQNLQKLFLRGNQLRELPVSLSKLKQIQMLDISYNHISELPESIRSLHYIELLDVSRNHLTSLPNWVGSLTELRSLIISGNNLVELPKSLGQLINLQRIFLQNIELDRCPTWLNQLSQLKEISLSGNNLKILPDWISDLQQLETLYCHNNQLTDIPSSIVDLDSLKELRLDNNPLNLALKSAYEAGLNELRAYLRSLENAEPLYEAKLVLVGEGNVGKTTLLKALKGRKEAAPQKNEPTTHGVEIDIHGLLLPHPTQDGVEIQLNAWDFGGQDVYRVTHQFFFSRRSLYLLVWEPRRGVQAGQVEDWLNMIRLRAGNDARVLIVSTHCKTGERIARIDKPVLMQQYGNMIVGFYEVDSLVPDENTGEMVGIAQLKKVIAEQAAQLEQMGMRFNRNWKSARDELIAHAEPRVSDAAFAEICLRHGLSPIDAETLAHLMHDLGYIVHYSDDERLRDDVVLQPQWLTKAIGFVLEDRATQESEGILPDTRLQMVWHDHPFENEPRYDPSIYPFFLRLMEKYDVSYRLPDGKASLVAQHVPQVRPELPWLPEGDPPENLRRIAMICTMEEDPPGLVPWMIVRTRNYSTEQPAGNGNVHRLHWQNGMFLSYAPHGEAMLEKRGREFHIYAQAIYPEYFMNVIQHTLQKLITDNWPGMEDRYRFMVRCPTVIDGQPCRGRFNIQALRQFLIRGVREYPCQECFTPHSITELLMGFEERAIDVQLREINQRLAGLESRIANYFMATMRAIADEATHGPRLFTFRTREAGLSSKQLLSHPLELQFWCEAEGCQHPVIETGKGVYSIDQPPEWVKQIAPFANFILTVLATVAPIAAPAINTFFGAKTTETWGISDHLELAKSIIDKLPSEIKTPYRALSPGNILSESERSGILALHRLLNQLDPTQERLGLHRIATYTGDYRWLCKHHYEAWQPNIPDVIQSHD